MHYIDQVKVCIRHLQYYRIFEITAVLLNFLFIKESSFILAHVP